MLKFLMLLLLLLIAFEVQVALVCNNIWYSLYIYSLGSLLFDFYKLCIPLRSLDSTLVKQEKTHMRFWIALTYFLTYFCFIRLINGKQWQ